MVFLPFNLILSKIIESSSNANAQSILVPSSMCRVDAYHHTYLGIDIQHKRLRKRKYQKYSSEKMSSDGIPAPWCIAPVCNITILAQEKLGGRGEQSPRCISDRMGKGMMGVIPYELMQNTTMCIC